MKSLIKNKEGSSIVLLAMVFVVMMISITAAVGIARALVVKSECEAFGHVWNKAILSEYDVNLFKEYNIMAYWGNEAEVQKKIDKYLDYSAGSKLDAGIGHSAAELTGYQLSDVDNFRKAMKLGFISSEIDRYVNGNNRSKRSKESSQEYEGRKIANPVVLDTLPSDTGGSSIDFNSITSGAKFEQLLNSAMDLGIETAFINKYMGSHVFAPDSKKGFMCNEFEYIIIGDNNDEENYKLCKIGLIAARQLSNSAYIFSDGKKMEVISSIAECVTPGLLGAVTTVAIVEIWAGIETSKDMDTLLDGGRVPFIKTEATWETDIDSVLDSGDLQRNLDDESQAALSEKTDEIKSMKGASGSDGNPSEGQTYDEYLLAMMMLVNKDVRTRRIMDLVQINMKYWHCRDFNMDEYYTGVRYSISANGKSYDFEDSYK